MSVVTTAVVRVEGAAKTGEFLISRGVDGGGVEREERTVKGLLDLVERAMQVAKMVEP